MTEQISNTERSATIDYIEKNITHCKAVIKDNDKSTNEAIRDWAISLKRLSELGKREGPLSLIASEIRRVCKHDFGWTDNQCDLIRHVLDSEFKDHRYDKLTKQRGSRSSLENLNPELLDPFSQEENLAKVDDLDELYQRIKYIKYKVEKYADERGKSLVDHAERHKKISTPRLKEEGESNMSFNLLKLSKTLLMFNEYTERLAGVVKQYPPTDSQFDKEAAAKFIRLDRMFDNLALYIRDIADKRLNFSPLQRSNMSANITGMDIPGIAKHPDTPKPKGDIQTLDNTGSLTDNLRGMTNKGIKKTEQKMNMKVDELLDSLEGTEKLIRYFVHNLDQWCGVKSEFKNAKATRRDDVSPELSDAA